MNESRCHTMHQYTHEFRHHYMHQQRPMRSNFSNVCSKLAHRPKRPSLLAGTTPCHPPLPPPSLLPAPLHASSSRMCVCVSAASVSLSSSLHFFLSTSCPRSWSSSSSVTNPDSKLAMMASRCVQFVTTPVGLRRVALKGVEDGDSTPSARLQDGVTDIPAINILDRSPTPF